MELTFFGTRGSCPCAGERFRKYGGNTSCVLIEVAGDDPLILDLGTGLRPLGESMAPLLQAEGRPLQATALLTHLHFDHILGLPFFEPLRDPGALLSVYGPRQEGGGLQETLPKVVEPPFFPVQLTELRGEVSFIDTGDDTFLVGTAQVVARSVPHVGHTLGFRIVADAKVVAYIPDHQAPLDRKFVPEAVLELCQGADVVIHDAQYSDDEFMDKADWGHSTVAYAVRVAAESGAKRLVLFHHDPSHADRDIDKLTAVARHMQDAKRLSEVSAASEGMTIDLTKD